MEWRNEILIVKLLGIVSPNGLIMTQHIAWNWIIRFFFFHFEIRARAIEWQFCVIMTILWVVKFLLYLFLITQHIQHSIMWWGKHNKIFLCYGTAKRATANWAFSLVQFNFFQWRLFSNGLWVFKEGMA